MIDQTEHTFPKLGVIRSIRIEGATSNILQLTPENPLPVGEFPPFSCDFPQSHGENTGRVA